MDFNPRPQIVPDRTGYVILFVSEDAVRLVSVALPTSESE